MKGKAKCKALKEIRKKIAEENDIEYIVSECTHQGDCKGTCPKCEAEVRYLERQLALRENLGKAAAVAGVAASVCLGLTACDKSSVPANTKNSEQGSDNENRFNNILTALFGDDEEPLAGDVVEVNDPDEYDGGLVEPDDGYDPGQIEGEEEYIPEEEPEELAGDVEYIPDSEEE